MTDEAGRPVDRLRKHLTGAARPDALSESFPIVVHGALRDELASVDVRLPLWLESLARHALSGHADEDVYQSGPDQHRMAPEFVHLAEQRRHVRGLARRTRKAWVGLEGAFQNAVTGAGLEAARVGLVASQSPHYPQKFTDTTRVDQIGAQVERLWHDVTVTTAKEPRPPPRCSSAR